MSKPRIISVQETYYQLRRIALANDWAIAELTDTDGNIFGLMVGEPEELENMLPTHVDIWYRVQ